MTFERVFRPAGPYTLALCTKHVSDATRHVRDGTLTTTLRVGERVEVATARQTLDGSVVLRAASEEGLERLRFVLAVDADHTEFLRRFARDPLIGETASRFQGMRQLGLHASRAAALVRICRSTDLERLHTLSTAKAAAFIERQRGLGPWSAGVVCLEGLGRSERGLVGDLTLVKLMSRLRGRWVEAHETAELLAPYGEWGGLAGLYLMMGFKHGLIPLPEERPLRFPRPAYT